MSNLSTVNRDVLEHMFTDMRVERDALNELYDTGVACATELRAEYDALSAKNIELGHMLEAVVNMREDINAALKLSNEVLRNKNAELNAQYDELSTAHLDLIADNNALSAENRNLKEWFDAAQREIMSA